MGICQWTSPIDIYDGHISNVTVESLPQFEKTSTVHKILSIEKLEMHLPLDLQVGNEKRVYNIDFDASVHSPWAVAEAVCLNNHMELKLQTVADIVNGCIPSIQTFIESAVRLRLEEIQMENSNSDEATSESNDSSELETPDADATSEEETSELIVTSEEDVYEANESSEEVANESLEELASETNEPSEEETAEAVNELGKSDIENNAQSSDREYIAEEGGDSEVEGFEDVAKQSEESSLSTGDDEVEDNESE